MATALDILKNLFTTSEIPVVTSSISSAALKREADTDEKRFTDTWLEASPVHKDMPEKQLWRVARVYSLLDRVERAPQVSFEIMLEKLKTEELTIARDAGMTGTDEEVLTRRLEVAGRNNVLRVIADGKVVPVRKFSGLRTGMTAAFAIAAAAFVFTGAEKTEAATTAPAVPAPAASIPAGAPAPVAEIPAAPLTGVASFDYSTNNGTYMVGSGAQSFGIHFSKSDDTSIHVYNYDKTIDRVARVKNAAPGAAINFDDVDSSSRVYTIEKGETFLLRNKDGYYMQARLRSVADDSRGASADKVVFEYQINADKSGLFTALPTGDMPVVNKMTIKPPRY